MGAKLVFTDDIKHIIHKLYVVESKSLDAMFKGLSSYGFNVKKSALIEYIKTNKLVKSKDWTDIELAILKRYYPEGGSTLCIEKGLTKTQSAIYSMASRIDLKVRDSWSDKDKDILKNTTLKVVQIYVSLRV